MRLKKTNLKAFTLLLSASLLCCTASFAKSLKTDVQKKQIVKESPPPIALFTPGLLQPGGLIAFGENILPQGGTKISLFADDYGGPGTHFIDLSTAIVYGITNRLSILLNLPYAASYSEGADKSSGIEDISTQLEYAYYVNTTSSYQEQATVLANVSFPTGSASADPQTGKGSPTYFGGLTYNRTYNEWFYFLSPGAYISTDYHGTQYGNKYLYQLGFGRNIFEIAQKWIFAFVTEFDGQYIESNVNNGVTDSNSGGNTIFLTPSLSLTGKNLGLQGGVGIPVVQNLFGNQTRTNYLLALSLSWTF